MAGSSLFVDTHDRQLSVVQKRQAQAIGGSWLLSQCVPDLWQQPSDFSGWEVRLLWLQ